MQQANLGDWRELDSAPKNERVIICFQNSILAFAILKEKKDHKSKHLGWEWDYGQPERFILSQPAYWMPCPLPPRDLHEKKLLADALRRQLKELEGEPATSFTFYSTGGH